LVGHGVPVGVVEAAEPGTQGGRIRAVSPFVDFTNLSAVSVVLDALAQPGELDSAEVVTEGTGVRPAPQAQASDADGAEDPDADSG